MARSTTQRIFNFFEPLEATVDNANGLPEPGVTVTFVAPQNGASGTFANGLTTVQVITNSDGVAIAPVFTANATAGSYVVTAGIAGVPGTADFFLTNDLAPTGTLVISDTNPSDLGAPVTFTAVVAPPAPNYGVPTGTVEFFANFRVAAAGADNDAFFANYLELMHHGAA